MYHRLFYIKFVCTRLKFMVAFPFYWNHGTIPFNEIELKTCYQYNIYYYVFACFHFLSYTLFALIFIKVKLVWAYPDVKEIYNTKEHLFIMFCALFSYGCAILDLIMDYFILTGFICFCLIILSITTLSHIHVRLDVLFMFASLPVLNFKFTTI